MSPFLLSHAQQTLHPSRALPANAKIRLDTAVSRLLPFQNVTAALFRDGLVIVAATVVMNTCGEYTWAMRYDIDEKTHGTWNKY
eukprot:scaffold396011_cov11-Prasinocladus_malaysianus.AAC.1